MRRSLRAAGLGRHESGPSSSDHQDPVSPPIAPPSWVPDPPPMDPGKHLNTQMYDYGGYHLASKVLLMLWIYNIIFQPRD